MSTFEYLKKKNKNSMYSIECAPPKHTHTHGDGIGEIIVR